MDEVSSLFNSLPLTMVFNCEIRASCHGYNTRIHT